MQPLTKLVAESVCTFSSVPAFLVYRTSSMRLDHQALVSSIQKDRMRKLEQRVEFVESWILAQGHH